MNSHGQAASSTPLISIVDDEECVRESVSSLIRSLGCRAKEYGSVEDFLTWGWWDDSDCLLLDVRLPGMGGLELQRYLAGRLPDSPVVFISGQATESEEQWALRHGAVAFLRKPFSDEALLQAVAESVARKRARTGDEQDASLHRACPICHTNAEAISLPQRFLDHEDLHAATVQVIKRVNPEWTEVSGLCRRCWNFYLSISLTLRFLREPHSPPSTISAHHTEQ